LGYWKTLSTFYELLLNNRLLLEKMGAHGWDIGECFERSMTTFYETK